MGESLIIEADVAKGILVKFEQTQTRHMLVIMKVAESPETYFI